MADLTLNEEDEAVRGALTRLIAQLGYAPSEDKLACEAGIRADEVSLHLERLADAHALLLHPGSTRPWAVHPFALAPGSCWVQTSSNGYWANYLYCGLGIAAALNCDAEITTRYGGEKDTVTYKIADGQVSPAGDLFHLSTPPKLWWDNVVFACSTFQPFQAEADIDAWCASHAFPRGATMTIPQLWAFAQEWYGDYVSRPWHKRSGAEILEVFSRHGLAGPFWSME